MTLFRGNVECLFESRATDFTDVVNGIRVFRTFSSTRTKQVNLSLDAIAGLVLFARWVQIFTEVISQAITPGVILTPISNNKS